MMRGWQLIDDLIGRIISVVKWLVLPVALLLLAQWHSS
jgi:hypothetical protein